MEKNDVKSLFAFFTALRPKWQPNKSTELAWLIMLQPYSYEDVMRGATACLRRNTYIPDPAEILAEIGGELPGPAPAGVKGFTAKELAALDAYEDLKERRIAAGLPPTLSCASTIGLSVLELAEHYDAAGLSISGGAA